MSSTERSAGQEVLVTVVIGFRASHETCDRVRNLNGCLAALQYQDLSREHYRIVLVEQDQKPTSASRGEWPVDEHVFAYNPGPFNRGWGLNIGARLARTGVLCLLDADLVVPADFLSRGLSAWRSGALVLRPYTEVLYLTEDSTRSVLASLHNDGNSRLGGVTIKGNRPSNLVGGCSWIDAALYHQVGGHDERFEGWGDEDRELWHRLSGLVSVVTLPGRVLHLKHQRHESSRIEGRANRLLYIAVTSGMMPPQRGPVGDVDRYRGRHRSSEHVAARDEAKCRDQA